MDTVIEYRKGILFIRLIGNLTKETCPLLEKEVNHIIKEYQIKNIVINLEELKTVDMKGINILYYIYELNKKNKGRVLISDLSNEEVRKRLKKSRLLNYIKEIQNELVAFKLIQV